MPPEISPEAVDFQPTSTVASPVHVQVSLLLEMAHTSQQQNIQLQAQLTALTQGLAAATAIPAISASSAAATLSLKASSISSAKQEPAAPAPSSLTPPAMSERAKTLSRLGFNAAVSGSFDSEEDENLHMLKGGIWRAEDPDPQEETEQPPSPSRWAWAANRASPRVVRQGGRSEPRSDPRGRDTLDQEDPLGGGTLDSHDEGATQSGQQEQQESGEVLRRSYDPDDALIANPFRGGVGESDAARERRVAPAAKWDEASAGVEYVPPGRKEWNSQQRGKMEVERRAAAAVAAAAAAATAAAAQELAQQVAAATPEYIAALDARQQREAEEARAWQEQEERVALQIAAELEAAAEKLAAAKLAAGRRAAADLAAADLALAQHRLASFQPAFPQVTEAEDREMFLREEEDGLKELQRHMQQWQQQSSAAAPALSVPQPSSPASAAAPVGPETIIVAPSTLLLSVDSQAVAEVDDEDDEFLRMMEEELNNPVPPASAAVFEAAATVRSVQSTVTDPSPTSAAAPALVSPIAPALGNAASPLDLLMQELLSAELNSASVKGGGGSSSSPPSRTSSSSKKPQSFPRRAVSQQAQQQPPQRQQQPEASATSPAPASIRIPLVTRQEALAALSSMDVQGLSVLEQMNLLPRVDKVLLTPGPPPARGEAVAAAAARPLAAAAQRQGQRDSGRGGGGRGRDDRVKDDFRGIKSAPTEVLSPAAAAAAALLRGPPKSSRQRIASRSYGETGASGGPTAPAASTAM